ncbi:MAG: hypothetical protein KAJ95_04060, partial [Gammaproteobacteria bacterium]|nr:hypothetical protein [Gammaproteobacteria bacterium]
MQIKTMPSKYDWSTPCTLSLEYGAIKYRPETELWVFCLLDYQNNEVYRNDISDKETIFANAACIKIDTQSIRGKPVRYTIWPRLEDGSFTEKSVFPLPLNFLMKYDGLFEWILNKTIPQKSVSCFIFGGLANQLFQIMTTVVFARQHGYAPIIYNDMDSSPSMVKNQDVYWDKIFS